MKLYCTIENIISELAGLICATKNMNSTIVDYYEELCALSDGLELAMDSLSVEQEEAADQIFALYLDMIDLYVDDIEKEANGII